MTGNVVLFAVVTEPTSWCSLGSRLLEASEHGYTARIAIFSRCCANHTVVTLFEHQLTPCSGACSVKAADASCSQSKSWKMFVDVERSHDLRFSCARASRHDEPLRYPRLDPQSRGTKNPSKAYDDQEHKKQHHAGLYFSPQKINPKVEVFLEEPAVMKFEKPI